MYSTTKKETTLASDSLKMYSTNQDYGTNSEISQGLVTLQDNQALTTSLKIAEYFGKDHSRILKDIRSLLESNEVTQGDFALSEYLDSTGRKLPAYNLTKDGFTLLAMGFTGSKALKFKTSYIKAFNLMEAKLKEQATNQVTLPSYAETLRLYADTLEAKEQLEANYQKALPKIAFHDQVATSINSITVGEFAKVIGTGEGRLFKWFKENGYLITSQQPYQSYIERGYFKVIEKVRTSPITGEQVTYFQVLVTGKGQSYFSSKFNA